jgi:hypothetical protein
MRLLIITMGLHMLQKFKSYIGITAALTVALATFVSFSAPAYAEDEISSVVRGGLLYDKWYKVIKADKPTDTHPAWPASNT